MSAPLSASPSVRFSRLTLAYTVFVILFGAVVRITGSGAGCGQHWPTCNGEVAHLPRTLETAIELTHRVTSGLALLLVLALLVLAVREHEARHPVRRLAFAVVALMVLEALIGAGLVLLALVDKNTSVARAIVMPAHLISTYALTATLTLLAAWREGASLRRFGGSSRALVIGSALLLIVVSATGAVTALGDTVYPPAAASLGARLAEDQGGGAHFLMRLRVVHPVLAVLAGALVIQTARRLRAGSANARLHMASRAVVAFAAVQLGAGVLNVFLSAPGWLQVLHLALALGLWISFVLLAFEMAQEAPAPRLGSI